MSNIIQRSKTWINPNFLQQAIEIVTQVSKFADINKVQINSLGKDSSMHVEIWAMYDIPMDIAQQVVGYPGSSRRPTTPMEMLVRGHVTERGPSITIKTDYQAKEYETRSIDELNETHLLNQYQLPGIVEERKLKASNAAKELDRKRNTPQRTR